MKKTNSVVLVVKASYAAIHFFGVSQGIALGETPFPTLSKDQPTETSEDLSKSSGSTDSLNQLDSSTRTFVSQGQVLEMHDLGLSLTPPKNWEVSQSTSGLSLVIREARDPNPAYDKPKYQRNITMAVIHSPAPVDEKRAKDLEAQLIRNFSQDGSAHDFKIIEHKFFDYKGDKDGLLVYSSMTIGEFPMMQMHVLLGGEKKQFLFTYTDLASRFTSEESGAYQAAWSTIVGAEILGQAPSRLTLYRTHMISGVLLAAIFALLGFLRFRARRTDYKSEADSLMEAEDTTLVASKMERTQERRRTPRTSSAMQSSLPGFSAFGSLARVSLSAHSRDAVSRI